MMSSNIIIFNRIRFVTLVVIKLPGDHIRLVHLLACLHMFLPSIRKFFIGH